MKKTPSINLHRCDCMDFMRDKPDGFWDLAIVDPPYGIGEDGNSNNSRGGRLGSKMNGSGTYVASKKYTPKKWDNQKPDNRFFSELFRVSRNQIIWGGNYFGLPGTSCFLVWDKLNSGDFADCELAWASFKTAVRKFEYRWNGMLQGDMRNKETRIHPTQKPTPLYRWLLQNYARPGDRILDTHGGSMSIALACYDLGFDLDLCELDADYFSAGKARFDRHVNRWHEGLDTPIKDENDYSQIGIFAQR